MPAHSCQNRRPHLPNVTIEAPALRRKAPRQRHADLCGALDREPVAILARGDRNRVPELVPVRYERMLTSPFAFLRGAAAVMAEDLRHQPAAGIAVQARGDCHLMNFGAFAAPEGIKCYLHDGFVINLQSAKAFDLDVPPGAAGPRTDEVIQRKGASSSHCLAVRRPRGRSLRPVTTGVVRSPVGKQKA